MLQGQGALHIHHPNQTVSWCILSETEPGEHCWPPEWKHGGLSYPLPTKQAGISCLDIGLCLTKEVQLSHLQCDQQDCGEKGDGSSGFRQ